MPPHFREFSLSQYCNICSRSITGAPVHPYLISRYHAQGPFLIHLFISSHQTLTLFKNRWKSTILVSCFRFIKLKKGLSPSLANILDKDERPVVPPWLTVKTVHLIHPNSEWVPCVTIRPNRCILLRKSFQIRAQKSIHIMSATDFHQPSAL